MRLVFNFVILCAVVALPGAMCAADVTAGQYLGGGTLSNFSRATGFRFTVATPVTVTALGLWDENGDGLADLHEVGIFRRTDLSTVATAVVPAGTAASLIDGSRFVAISPVTLQAGVEY